INVPDTVGYSMPEEYAAMWRELYRLVPDLAKSTRSSPQTDSSRDAASPCSTLVSMSFQLDLRLLLLPPRGE
ncbi:MAG TPA: hypothetical protein VFE45_11180, partial [Coriobacteriia bacterium]|nr:hypothetical protein [Coriobacteriia bacterium]